MITTSLELGLLVLSVEVIIVSMCIMFFSNRRLHSAREVNVAAATQLVEKVENSEDNRKLALATVFREKYRFSEDDIPSAVEEFLSRERAFYNAVLGAYLNRGDAELADLNDELTKVVAPWISLTPKGLVDSDSLAEVEDAKNAVEVELSQTKEILETMMREYDKAFNKEAALAQVDDEDRPSTIVDDENIEPAPLTDDEVGEDGGESVLAEAQGEEPDDGEIDATQAAQGEVALDPAFDLGDDEQHAAPAAETSDEPVEPKIPDPDQTNPVLIGDEPMTADDLDALMEGLQSDPEEEELDSA